MGKTQKHDPLSAESLDEALDQLEEQQLTKQEEAFRQKLLELDEATLFIEGKRHIEEALDIKLVPDATSPTCLIRVASLSSPIGEPGIKLPGDFKYAMPISGYAYEELIKRWREILFDMPTMSHAMFWWPLFSSNTSANASSPLENYVSRKLKLQAEWDAQYEAQAGHHQGIAVHPDKCIKHKLVPRAFVPEANWFDERFAKLTPADIITLMPPKELEMFCIFLGRALCGRSQSIPIGETEPLSHKFRKMAIVYGKDPRTGKSTLLEAIISAMRSLGFSVSIFRNLGDRFNTGGIFTSDLAFKDDATRDSANQLLGSEATKMLIAGSQMRVENKGKDSYNVVPNCAVLFITNELDQTVLYAKDNGVVDRCAILYTYSHAELANLQPIGVSAKSPDLHTYEHLNWLADKLGTTVRGLMLWLFRYCADLFLSTMQGQDAHIQRLTNKFRFPLSHQSLPNIVSAMHLSHLLRRGSQARLYPLSNKKTFCFYVNNFLYVAGDLRAHHIRTLIKEHWEKANRPTKHPWLGFSIITKPSLIQAQEALSLANSAKMPIDDAIHKVFGSFRNEDGIGVGSNKHLISQNWQECYGTLLSNTLRSIAQLVLDEHKADAKLCKMHSDLLDPTVGPDLAYAEDIGFDAKLISSHLGIPQDYNEDEIDWQDLYDGLVLDDEEL